MNAIEAVDLTKDYKKLRAVDHINFIVEPGEIFGFLGPNGAGKSTTIRMLTGQLRPTGGRGKVAGFDIVDERKELQSRIGIVFEHQNIYERISARDNLNFAARLYGADRHRVDDSLAMVGLLGREKEKVSNYSNGMKQRLLIARALLPEPEIIFLDEPTRGLDPGVARAIRGIITDLAKNGVTIFLTTHYMEEADQLCNRVAIIDLGRIIALDTPAQLKTEHNGEDASLEDVFIQLTGKNLYR